ncbi:SurA N-terminal domain-containing protein [Thermocatellispora tengchongensis]|uniref:hypothetical protein n=1 Tax=Thermocatellispora tengchongensis TaxID=1073253 RepID=UPI00362A2155
MLPLQAGAAAIVGDERITASQVEADVRETQAALKRNPDVQQQLQFSLPQTVLLQRVVTLQYLELGNRNGVSVSDGELDAFVAQQGGEQQVELRLLGSGVPPSQARGYIRAYLTEQKLLAKFGGGTDEAALQRGQQAMSQELDKVKVTYSPRYGAFDPQQGFVAGDRFGKVPQQAPAADAGQAGQ